MAISVVMPALEMAQETGKLVSWLKKEGERVSKGEPLLEIETDKAVMEIESPGEGVLAAVTAQPGAEVQVGRTIAWIVQPGEQPPKEQSDTVSGRKLTADGGPVAAQVAEKQTATAEVRVSPKARRLAKEFGLDLTNLRGSGPEGEILAEDVTRAAGPTRIDVEPSPTPARAESGSIARLMAERTTQSWTSVPHFFLTRDIDAGDLQAARERFAPPVQASQQVKLTITDLLVAITAKVLARHSRMNASWIDGQIRYNSAINIAIAIGVDEGVVAPVIQDADRLELGAIAQQRAAIAQRARSGRLRQSDLSRGTFTISNLGMFDVDSFTAIITPPQSAILAVGRIADHVVAIDGRATVRPRMTMSLSSDHRVIDGLTAARFMKELVEKLTKANGD
jgi:pyruvate dehydrogenase E2 component (dihydrolipoamide acetyltransferase)